MSVRIKCRSDACFNRFRAGQSVAARRARYFPSIPALHVHTRACGYNSVLPYTTPDLPGDRASSRLEPSDFFQSENRSNVSLSGIHTIYYIYILTVVIFPIIGCTSTRRHW